MMKMAVTMYFTLFLWHGLLAGALPPVPHETCLAGCDAMQDGDEVKLLQVKVSKSSASRLSDAEPADVPKSWHSTGDLQVASSIFDSARSYEALHKVKESEADSLASQMASLSNSSDNATSTTTAAATTTNTTTTTTRTINITKASKKFAKTSKNWLENMQNWWKKFKETKMAKKLQARGTLFRRSRCILLFDLRMVLGAYQFDS
eukprot:gnl/TRDRNA2_/TRDRNA2_81691_c0_seq1.p1 gnl/TRDRNA2_/TRDRNA2_81691_c0~~gnl/TRDRNA2_/TRDRNA2_81691_c0_seq1.p1  ORF type:complete len:205 (-),score=38.83 gnl/TRDRNA2_/TRDRNA2_81691_c0_seq1:139-753(-)